jgi:hypothetical protein
MPPEKAPLVLRAGQIVVADWRRDAISKEPNKRRPADVVEEVGLFAPADPNAILVPPFGNCHERSACQLRRDKNAIAAAPARQARPPVPKLRVQAASRAVPPK